MKLTKPQKLMYDMAKVNGGAITVNCSSMLISGKKGEAEMQAALNELFRLNDALRIRINETDGVVTQYVTDFIEREFDVLYFQNKEELDRYADAYSKKAINLTDELCDFKLVILPQQFGLLTKLHHIISDAWTFGIIFTQFNSLINKEKVCAYSYFEYCKTENLYINSKRYEKDKAFFLKQVKDCESVTFIDDRKATNLNAERKVFIIEPQNAQKINSFAEKNNCSVFSIFALALATYISRVKMNSEKFFIGTTILNRNNEKELNTAGIFINTVPLLVDLDTEKSFFDNLEMMENSLMSVFRHQRYNYNALLSDIRKENLPHEKLYDVLISYMNATINFTEGTIHSTWHHNGMQNESLQIHIDDRDNEDIFKMHYDFQTEKFTCHDIEMLHKHICSLLFDALDNPDKKVYELELLTPAEKQKLFCDFNDTAADYPWDKCVHKLFEEQAEKNPDKAAIVACDKTLTYRELNEESGRVASALIEKGVKPNDFVAFDLKRRSYTFSAIFGILKAGAIFVPVNNDYPEERKTYIAKDSKAAFVINEDNIEELLNCSDVHDSVKVSPESLCYCIYTSGSTGNPKGTLITHRNVSNLSHNNEKNMYSSVIKEEYNSICSFATVGFDMFIAESLLPLLNGMTVIFANEEQSISQKEAALLFVNHTPDIFQCTPSKLKLLTADRTNCDYLRGVKGIIIGGENFDLALYYELKNITEAKIYNFYGPTEATVWVSNAEVKDEDVHIGKPMANTQIYIVDKYLNPVATGVVGELCIAGDCVGAGYLNRPELTGERFVDNPFGLGKLYKTGDLAYRREDGNIGYVGRNDFQVKIRGLRIELGEIENAISSVKGIGLVVAVVRKNSEGRQLICAFYTGEKKEAKTIRAEIGEKIPKYMIPHIFTHLKEMPLTASGKINRKALPEINLENIGTETEYVAPETKEEAVLTGCIEDVLGTEQISTLDNFFDIGGDSLKAIELTSRLETKGYEMQVKTIFAAENIKALAKELTVKEKEKIKAEYGSVLPVTPSQMRVYTAQMMEPDSPLYNIPYVFRTEEVDSEKLERAINKLIERHESLRTHFENRNGQIVQVIDQKSEIRIQKLKSEDVSAFTKPFDLRKSPLVRVGYYENTIMIDMHHIIVDGETMPVFFKELNELYMEREIENKAVQYGEFAVQERSLKESERHWLKLFEEEVPTLELPTDYPRKEKQTFKGSAHYDLIDIKLHEKIKDKCKELGITPYVFYMTCFNIMLSKYSGNEDIVVGMPISGRSSRFLETVGMFVNTIALRSRPEGNKRIYELMQEIRDNSIAAIDNQDYPFGELVKKLNIEVGGRNPLYDVMFAYQSYEMTDILFGDKKAELIPAPVTASKCDFTFTVLPRKDDVVVMAEYCTDLYNRETVEKFTESFKQILESCLEEQTLIKDVAVISDDEWQKLIKDFNDTKVTYPILASSTIYSLFEERAEKAADRTCIITAEKKITFGELSHLSETLDEKIRSLTNGKKSVIAVIADRSVEMYSAIYGIIRGGNAYLPLSPDYPKERIEYILRNSGAALVAAQDKYTHLSGNVPSIDMTEFVNNPPEIRKHFPCNAEEDDTAYVIYTSGSTGNPKGAKISHKSAVNRILWMHDKYPLEENSVILQKTPFTFDVSVWEIFWWGMCGGSLAASKPGEHFLPAKILEETDNNKVTHLHFVPSVFELFLNYLEAHKDECARFSSVKHVFLSGEALTASLIQRFYELYDYGSVKLHNLYGPTECAVDVTYYDCVPKDTDPVPIGKPIYNTAMYVTDKYMNILPIGVKGELCIGGVNVGQGYLNNEELTAEKFISSPFGEGKLYKTGDLAYRREDGEIIFCGRMDGQVKLNGQRIETGEIEAVIGNIPQVEAVAVIIRKINGQDTLAAFYCGEEGIEKTIKSICEAKMPRYMVPKAICHIEEMPLNPSGKLDRRVLSSLEVTLNEPDAFEEPKNESEKYICEAFSKVLEDQRIGRNCNFFELGGSSLSMISFLSEDRFKDITPADFISNATPAKLATLMKNKNKGECKYLETLYEAERTEKAIVLLPFAGGGAESYTSFVNSLKAENSNISIYFVRYLHSKEECEKAAKEIDKVLKAIEVYFYSHCVGSAIALQLLSLTEVTVKHYIAGASIPPKKASKKNSWNIVPDRVLGAILTKAGAPLKMLTDEKVTELLRQFRTDTDFAVESFAEKKGKIKTPVSVIISKKDIFTRNHKQAEKIWKNYAEDVRNIHFIDSATHYFQSENSDMLTKMLLAIIR